MVDDDGGKKKKKPSPTNFGRDRVDINRVGPISQRHRKPVKLQHPEKVEVPPPPPPKTFIERFASLGNILRALAAVLAIIATTWTLYNRYRSTHPAVQTIGIALSAERDLTSKHIVAGGGPAMVKFGSIKSAEKLRMTTKAVALAWHNNLRNDCALIGATIIFTSNAGERVPIWSFTGTQPQGEIGDTLDLISITIPSDMLPGDYVVQAQSTYLCDSVQSQYMYPAQKVKVTY